MNTNGNNLQRNQLGNIGGIVMLAGLLVLIFSSHYIIGLFINIIGLSVIYKSRLSPLEHGDGKSD